MSTYRIATTIAQNGLLELSALPFRPGELVEVTVQSVPSKNSKTFPATPQKQSANMRVAAIATIQSGKYAKVLSSGAPFASDEFAMQKQAEQAQEERRRSA